MSFAPRSIVVGAIVLFGLVAAMVGFAVHGPIERALFLRSARAYTGFESLDAARVDRDATGYALRDVHVATPDGAFILDAPSAHIAVDGAKYRIALAEPRVRFDQLAYRDADRARVRDAFAGHAQTGIATITIVRGTLAVGGAGVPSPMATTDIDGTLTVLPTRATFDGSLAVQSGGVAYPIIGAAREEDGAVVQGWTAAVLPLVAFAPLFAPDAAVRPVGGWLRDLDVSDGPNFRGVVRLDAVKLRLGAHTIHGLHGRLVALGDGIGTSALEGLLDDAPLHVVGEVHDLHSHYRWLARGTTDLRALANLAASIAGEPKLQGPVELEEVAPGLGFAQYHLGGDHGPLAISILSADPTEKTLRFDTAIANDRVISGGERTSAMGLRTRAVAGVNGDYFDIGRTYEPQGMLVRSGTLVRGPTDRAVLAIDRNNHVTFGEFHMRGELETAHGNVPVTEFNNWPPGWVDVITPAFGARLPPADVTFLALDPEGGTRYRVARVTPPMQRIDVHFGVAIGALAKVPIPAAGETVRLTYRTDPPLANAVAAIGGGPILLENGAWYEDPHAPAPDERDYRWPVVALVRMKDARLDLVAVDGRHPERSVGMTRPEFADLLLRLGGIDAMALDSGGSVTLVARAPGNADVTVRNVPSDNSAERWVSDALFLYSSAPAPRIVVPDVTTTPMPEVRPTP